ncbi:hypothetical protein [Zhaonella formicivorans]|uniref:hypothetical protein n=1 Tax=Zhaonella formicivorans TaxID=2528593 RepID=UPI0010EA6E32|nr:hypothetical protein [Zhaonella formicivorans]
MGHSDLCKIDCYGILQGLIQEGIQGDKLLRSFTWKYLELNKGRPGCYCDKVLNDLIQEGVKQEQLLDAFKKKQELVVKGFNLMVDEAIELAKKLPPDFGKKQDSNE